MLGYMAENILSGECDVIEPGELVELVDTGWMLVDVRTPGEHAAGSIPGSVNVPLDTLRENVASLGTGPIAVYCQVGQRGHTATEYLHRIGREARNLDGGYRTWLAAEAARRGDASLLVRPAS